MNRVCLVVATLLYLLFPGVVSAETIRSFNSQLLIHQDGTFQVKETIDYDFEGASRHGIYRIIPQTSKVADLYRTLKLSVVAVLQDEQPQNYQTSLANNSLEIKIGQADRLISGEHRYQIILKVENGQGNYDDHDEIYWNATGNGWQVPIERASVEVATDFATTLNGTKCFTGVIGSKAQDCSISDSRFPITFSANSQLNPGQGLSVVAGFPVNTFPKAQLSSQSPAESQAVGLIFVWLVVAGFLNLILAPALVWWYLAHKHKSHLGSITVNFDIPKDAQGERITPSEAGIVDNTRLDKDDVIATIFDFAIRKFLVIKEVEKPKILGFGGGKDYQLVKKNEPMGLLEHERQLYDRIFSGGEKTATLSDLSSDFYLTFVEMSKSVFASLISRGFFSKDPASQKALLIVAGVLAIFGGGIILAIVLFFLSVKLNGRTAAGDEMDWQVDGLKLFLKNMSREYKWQADNLYTVERYIPYAIALGYIDEFMAQLKIIAPNFHPIWYVGNQPFYSFGPSFYSSSVTSFRTNAPSSSSGFSGGGFSGGGGGGGGGGSW